ncbi:MAG: FKBP-type peptidyl-prolyl cis-trans isomerase [Dehalococcoidia bacterium]|nr:FKBP-type peptidyl-prolyl cis-trans isomerase [Chloroflexota bacterium]|tara:strand:- start:4768 stop:7578 length:2811 start_codon:yes stop_codon:yes gene_type:complete
MSQLRLNIDKYFPSLIFFGLSLILFMPLVVSPETVFPYVVGKTFWFKGIIYFIAGFYLILLSANKSYLPDKSFLILIFSLFVLMQAISGIASSSPVNSFWSNWERMEGVTDYFHWLVLLIVSSSVLRKEKSWIKLLKINTYAGFIVAFLGLLEFFNIVIPIFFGLDIFPSVVNPDQSYTLGERVESTIGNPTYVASYLSLISFISIGLVLREFQLNFKQSIRNTFLNFNLNSRIFVLISTFGILISIWTILNSGSRASLIGIFIGISFIILMLSLTFKSLRKYLYAAFILIGSLTVLFFISLNLIESQRNNLKDKIVKNYIPEIYLGDEISYSFSNFDSGDGYNLDGDINSILNQLEFLKIFQNAERSTNTLMDMKSLSDYIEKNNLYSTSLNNEIYCSDEIILYFWITNRYSFKECTPIMKTISIFGTGFTYPFKSGFNIGERQYAWTIALKGFISNPLLGIGPENFPILHYKYLELEMSDDSPHLDRAHNRILHVLATTGIFGAFALIVLWISVMIIITKKILIKKNNIFWILLGSAFLSYMASSMFMFSVSSTYLQVILIISLLSKSSEINKIDTLKEKNDERFTKDSVTVITAIISLICIILLIRSYVYVPFSAAKITPPLGAPKSVIEMQDNINKFPKLANYGRQEMFYILLKDYDNMLSLSSEQGKFAENYDSLKTLMLQEYSKAIEIEPDHFNIHFATASLYVALSKFEVANLDKAEEILTEMKRLSPNSIQTLEIKIRLALLKNDDIEAEKLINLWRDVMPYQFKTFWDENLAISKGELIPEVEVNCKNDQYPADKPQFDNANLLYTNELEGGVMVGIKKDVSDDAPRVLPGTIVKMNYTGWLPDGCIFDSSYLPGMNPLSFLVGNNQAIPGIEESLITLSKGNIARIVIPAEKAYGSNGISGLIPPNSPIYFEVEILDVEVTGTKID